MNGLTDIFHVYNILNNIPGLVIWKNNQSNFLVANENYCKTVGTTIYEIVNNEFNESCLSIPLAEMYSVFRHEDQVTLKNNTSTKILGRYEFSPNQFDVSITTKKPLIIEGKTVGVAVHVQSVTKTPLIKLAHYLQASDQAFSDGQFSYMLDQALSQFGLTVRQMECLFHTIRGKTAKEIARIYDISPRTVETHLDHLKQKFNCQTKAQLIEFSIDSGLMWCVPDSVTQHLA